MLNVLKVFLKLSNSFTVITKFIYRWDRRTDSYLYGQQFGAFLEAYSVPCQTSKMELFAKIVIGLKPSNIFAKKLHVRLLAGY